MYKTIKKNLQSTLHFTNKLNIYIWTQHLAILQYTIIYTLNQLKFNIFTYNNIIVENII